MRDSIEEQLNNSASRGDLGDWEAFLDHRLSGLTLIAPLDGHGLLSKEGLKDGATPHTAGTSWRQSTEGIGIGDDASQAEVQTAWRGHSDPGNPRNWTKAKKQWTCIIISAFAFLGPLSSSIAAPALSNIGQDLGIPSGVQLELILSIFFLTTAFGPFILSPCSEIWGRFAVLLTGNLIFVIFTMLCGFAESQTALTIFRAVAGFGSSSTIGMGTAMLSDMWEPEERGNGIAVYQLAHFVGPAVGPIFGGLISEHTSWRWIFFVMAILGGVVQVVAGLFLDETYGPRIIELRERKARGKASGPLSQKIRGCLPHIPWPFLRLSMSRPWIMLATQPIIQLLAFHQAFNFGVLFLLITSFPALWEGRYGMPTGLASVNYLSLGIGSLLAVRATGPLMDSIYRRLKMRRGLSDDEHGFPEFRIPMMIPASIFCPCGIFLFAWSAEAKLHPVLPNIGAAIFAVSTMVSYQCNAAYIADCYEQYSASASAACSFLRSIFAFAFPLFAPYLFSSLGYGMGGSVIGIMTIVLGIPTPWILWKFGARIRLASRFSRPESEAESE